MQRGCRVLLRGSAEPRVPPCLQNLTKTSIWIESPIVNRIVELNCFLKIQVVVLSHFMFIYFYIYIYIKIYAHIYIYNSFISDICIYTLNLTIQLTSTIQLHSPHAVQRGCRVLLPGSAGPHVRRCLPSLIKTWNWIESSIVNRIVELNCFF